MKKTIALALSMALMTSTAIAANPSIGTSAVISPGSDIDITLQEFLPGTTGYMTTDTFSISNKKIIKGSNLVKEIKIDNDDEVVRITLHENMELAEPKSDNLLIEKLSIKAKRDTGDIKRGQQLSIEGISEKIGHAVNTINLTDSTYVELQDGYNKIDSNDNTIPYGDASYSMADLMMEGRVYKGDKIFVKGSQKANTTVLKAYPDADMRFVKLQTNGLPTSFKVMLSADKDEYVYKIAENGKLAASGLKWSEEDSSWTGKVRSSVDYVISSDRLTIAAVDESEEGVANPETGANDVVGIAAALAVVSLVAAGAVSLKK